MTTTTTMSTDDVPEHKKRYFEIVEQDVLSRAAEMALPCLLKAGGEFAKLKAVVRDYLAQHYEILIFEKDDWYMAVRHGAHQQEFQSALFADCVEWALKQPRVK